MLDIEDEEQFDKLIRNFIEYRPQDSELNTMQRLMVSTQMHNLQVLLISKMEKVLLSTLEKDRDRFEVNLALAKFYSSQLYKPDRSEYYLEESKRLINLELPLYQQHASEIQMIETQLKNPR